MTSVVRVESVAVTESRVTGEDIESAVLVAELPCRVKSPKTSPAADSAGGATVQPVGPELHFEWDAPGLRSGMRATILTSESPLLIGRVFRLVQPPEGEQMTAQRWGVESWAQQMS